MRTGREGGRERERERERETDKKEPIQERELVLSSVTIEHREGKAEGHDS
jgi:hypothetical protein